MILEDGRSSLNPGTWITITRKVGELDETVNYRIKKLIGVGGQALVYSAETLEGFPRCIKEFYPLGGIRKDNGPVAPPDGWDKIRESLRLSHVLAKQFSGGSQSRFLPIDWFEERMVEVMVLDKEFLTLNALVEKWEKEKLPPEKRIEKSAKIIQCLLRGLTKLHEFRGENDNYSGFIHRDLKPENILAEVVDESCLVCPIDFSACCEKDVVFPVTESSSTGFSHPWLNTSVQTDLYSVGCIFLFLVGGAKLLERCWGNILPDLSDAATLRDLVIKLTLPDSIRWKFLTILEKATTLEDDLQYSSALAFSKDIEILLDVIEHKGIHREVLLYNSTLRYRQLFGKIYGNNYDPDLCPEFDDRLYRESTLLVAAGGAGKTTALFRLWKHSLKNYENSPAAPIPIYVQLNDFDERSGGETYISNKIIEEFFGAPKDDMHRSLLRKLFKTGKYILLMDGIQESVDSSKLRKEICHYLEIPTLCICIPSRGPLDDNWSEVMKHLSKVELKPLPEELVLRKLNEKGYGAPTPRLLKTLERPMFLALFLKLKKADNTVQTPGEILLQHHKYLLASYKSGLHDDGNQALFEWEVNTLVPKLATIINRVSFTKDDVIEAVKRIPIEEEHINQLRIWGLDAYFGNIDRSDKKTMMDRLISECDELLICMGKNVLPQKLIERLLACGLIRKQNRERYVFSHHTYLEFYQAYDVFQEMGTYKKEQPLPACLSVNILPIATVQFLGELLGEYRWTSIENSSHIENWLQEFAAGKRGREAQMTARNLIQVMKVARNNMVTANYSGLDLTLTNFYNCNLRNSVFYDTILTEATFLHQGHSNPITQTEILESNGYLITTSALEKQICIWDIVTGQHIRHITCCGRTLQFDVSLDEKLIVVLEECIEHQYGARRVIEVFNLEDGSLVNRWKSTDLFPKGKDVEPALSKLYFTDDNRTLVGGTIWNGFHEVVLWDVYLKNQHDYLKLSDDSSPAIRELRFPFMCEKTYIFTLSADRRYLYAISPNREFAKWSLCKKKQVGHTVKIGDDIVSICPTQSKYKIVARTSAGKLLYFDTYTGKYEELFDVGLHDTITANDNILIWSETESDGTIRGWDVQNHKEYHFPTYMKSNNIHIVRSGKLLLFVDGDCVHLVDIQSKRIVCTVMCAYAPPNPREVLSWSKSGLIYKDSHDQICCVADKKSRVLPFPVGSFRTVCDDYYVAADIQDKESGRISVYEIGSGKQLLSAPMRPEWAAIEWSLGLDCTLGDVRFFGLNSIQWVLFNRITEHLLVCFSLSEAESCGLLWMWDKKMGSWKPVGDWIEEKICMLGALPIPYSTLSQINYCRALGPYCIIATDDGAIQFWTFDGKNHGRYHVHHSEIHSIYPVPNTTYFISEDENNFRCIWNWEKGIELIDSASCNSCIEGINLFTGNVDKDNILGIYNKKTDVGISPMKSDVDKPLLICSDEFDNVILYGCQKRDAGMGIFKRALSANTQTVAYAFDGEIYLYSPNSQELKCKIDVSGKISTGVSIMRIFFSPEGDRLAVVCSDGHILIFHLDGSIDHSIGVLSVQDISNCEFCDVDVSDGLKELLEQNGATVD